MPLACNKQASQAARAIPRPARSDGPRLCRPSRPQLPCPPTPVLPAPMPVCLLAGGLPAERLSCRARLAQTPIFPHSLVAPDAPARSRSVLRTPQAGLPPGPTHRHLEHPCPICAPLLYKPSFTLQPLRWVRLRFATAPLLRMTISFPRVRGQ